MPSQAPQTNTLITCEVCLNALFVFMGIQKVSIALEQSVLLSVSLTNVRPVSTISRVLGWPRGVHTPL